MTRINCLPVSELHDKHLVAEYRELPRVFKLARLDSSAPTEYVLGTGHMKFFYDKLMYLLNRQRQLVAEMHKRGFKTSFDPEELFHYHVKAGGHCPESLWNDWVPTEKAMVLNRLRIADRLNDMFLKRIA